MIGRTSLFARNTISQFVRNSGGHGGIPGENLPFKITNKYRLSAWFVAFFGSAFGLPYFLLKHQLSK